MGGRVSDITKLTEAGVDVIFNKAVKMPTMKYYPQIVSEKPNQKKIGKYETIGDLSSATEKGEGDAIVFDKISHNYETTITSSTKVKGVEASMEELEYDLYATVQKYFGSPLMQKMIILKERAVATAYNNAFATTTGADGVYVCSASHPLQRSALLNDNLATGALTPENLTKAKNKFNFIYDQSGEFFGSIPTHLLIHPNKMYSAMAILGSQLYAFELTNTKNTLQDVSPIKVISNPWITYNTTTDVSPWFLLDKTLADAGCVLQTKRGIQLKTWWENNNDVFRGACTEMYGVGFISPGYGLVGSLGS